MHVLSGICLIVTILRHQRLAGGVPSIECSSSFVRFTLIFQNVVLYVNVSILLCNYLHRSDRNVFFFQTKTTSG